MAKAVKVIFNTRVVADTTVGKEYDGVLIPEGSVLVDAYPPLRKVYGPNTVAGADSVAFINDAGHPCDKHIHGWHGDYFSVVEV